MFYIRTDGNKEIGSGHIMRCLSIAEQMRELGEEVVFLLADDTPADLIIKKGFDYEILHGYYKEMDKELPALLWFLDREKATKILVDSYYVTEHYLEELSKKVSVTYIDDMNMFCYPVDLVIDYNIFANKMNYEEVYKESEHSAKFLLGCEYVPLREEFLHSAYQVKEEVKHLFITTGGSDKFNIAGQLVTALLEHEASEKLEYHVVSGMFNEHKEYLNNLAKHNSCVHVYQNVKNMSELMKQCDLAITAGGSTMYELCAMGIPMVSFSFADNQHGITKTFAEEKIAAYAGDYRELNDKMIENVLKEVSELTQSYELRNEKSKRQKMVVDGKGARRIAEKLVKSL